MSGPLRRSALADLTFNADGSVVPLIGLSIMAGLTSHDPIKGLDLYAYAGENRVLITSPAGCAKNSEPEASRRCCRSATTQKSIPGGKRSLAVDHNRFG